ncbi:hypothetical protein [Deinococcus seoulensis]|uniref:hypothetical protein n=1 Tax=Deinococcus seoulensis TaxID=1837379 RepID=UPI001667D9ED|nr:hypothetical protein [Deinococcus seoulensis]
MTEVFRAAIARALPSPEQVGESLAHLSARDVQDAADYFSAVLPDFDVALVLPGAEALAGAVADLRGAFVVHAERHPSGFMRLGAPNWADVQRELRAQSRPARAALFTPQLRGGLDELEVLLAATHQGWTVQGVAAGVAHTNDAGRVRMELQGVPVVTPVMLADTPTGLVFERRFPQSA